MAERRLERIEKDLKRGRSADLDRERDLVQRCQAALEHGTPLRALQLAGDDLKRLRGFQFLSAKPLLLVINLDEADVAEVGSDLSRAAEKTGLTAFLARASTRAVALCAKIELEISQLDGADAKAFLSDLGLTESGLDRVIRTSYDLLGYISFFTVGEDECRAWSIARGTPAQLAAGEIHSDISRGLSGLKRAYDGSSAAHHGCVPRPRRSLSGSKEYVVQDGDIINFRQALSGCLFQSSTGPLRCRARRSGSEACCERVLNHPNGPPVRSLAY